MQGKSTVTTPFLMQMHNEKISDLEMIVKVIEQTICNGAIRCQSSKYLDLYIVCLLILLPRYQPLQFLYLENLGQDRL